MKPGEIIVVNIKGGPTLVRCLEPATPDGKGGGRVRVAMGRNREVQLPAGRVALATGVVASDADEVEELRRRSDELAETLDLSEAWDVVKRKINEIFDSEISEVKSYKKYS